MVAALVRFAVRRSLNDTRHIKVVKRRHATGLVAQVYRQVERDFKMLAPPVALHSAAPEILAASWMILRETLVAQGVADRASKEAVATGVSVANSCPYCEDVHGMTLNAIEAGDSDREALIAWAKASAMSSGAAIRPFDLDRAPELIGTAVAFHYYNRMVNVFLRDSPFPSHVPENAKPKARKVLGGVLRPSADGPRPGDSLAFLPDVSVAADLSWAGSNEVVASAFARAYAAIETAGTRSVPESVRSLVTTRMSTWDGQAPGISRSWVTNAIADLPEADRPAGTLALVVAESSYQVDEALIDAVRATGANDTALVELSAWASLQAARRISTWLAS